MYRVIVLLAGVVTVVSISSAQLKSQEQNQPTVVNSMVRPAQGMSGLLGWFNPENFSMHHSFSLDYLTSGESGLSMANYTNSMFYKIADPLNVRFDVSLQGSPFGQYGSAQQGDFNKLYLSRAELNYQPWENVNVKLLYRQIPLGTYRFYSPFYSPISGFGDE